MKIRRTSETKRMVSDCLSKYSSPGSLPPERIIAFSAVSCSRAVKDVIKSPHTTAALPQLKLLPRSTVPPFPAGLKTSDYVNKGMIALQPDAVRTRRIGICRAWGNGGHTQSPTSLLHPAELFFGPVPFSTGSPIAALS